MLKFNSLKQQIKHLSMFAFMAIVATGCASFNRGVKNLVGDDKPKLAKYSDQENLKFQSDRKYRRMNRNRFEDEADVNAQAGSLWVMEGQGAYLFAQNQTRMMGDLLNVRVEGNPRQQLSSKVKVISKLLDRLEAPQRGLAGTPVQAAKAGGAQGANPPAPQAGAAGAADGQAADPNATAAASQAATEKAGTFDPRDPISTIQTVPTRIVEQLKDGSYRVKGAQPFMIGKREYKVIVTGVVRPEDFDDSGIESSKLLDSQFDIVSSRKGSAL
ncbi:MAG: flagellar basal body L-ring protein FlgH [Deltaproteobacteria bacterium]|nr:flagellar basal body L-ring protein FlgH [Deltaproteobacteria bacterium]